MSKHKKVLSLITAIKQSFVGSEQVYTVWLFLTKNYNFMTGAYLRVERDGKWENIEVEHLTDKEREQLFKDRDKEEILRWFDLVCNDLATIDNQLLDRI